MEKTKIKEKRPGMAHLKKRKRILVLLTVIWLRLERLIKVRLDWTWEG